MNGDSRAEQWGNIKGALITAASVQFLDGCRKLQDDDEDKSQMAAERVIRKKYVTHSKIVAWSLCVIGFRNVCW